jgi:hypothetical protein
MIWFDVVQVVLTMMIEECPMRYKPYVLGLNSRKEEQLYR